jgi:transmembrane sensor
MLPSPLSAKARASREATLWLVRLQEDPNDALLTAEFNRWMAADPANGEAWAGVQRLSAAAKGLDRQLDHMWRQKLLAVRRVHAVRGGIAAMSHLHPTKTGRRQLLAIGGLALAACVALFVAPTVVLRLQSDAVTDTAEDRVIDLPDGSRLTLAGGSALAVSFAHAERRVSLLKGEAFFQVKPDAGRPFRVLTEGVTTTVVGTSFDVRRDSSGVAVAVAEGVVEVSAKQDAGSVTETLKPGQGVRIAWQGRPLRSTVPAEFVGSWRQRQLILEDQPLGEAVEQLRRYFAGTIVFADASLAEKGITGAYNLNDPADALQAMANAHGINVRQLTPWILVLSSW